MDNDLKKLRKMTSFMRKQGLLRLKTSEIELELHVAALDLEKNAPSIQDNYAPPTPERHPSADEIALGLPAGGLDLIDWSSPGIIPEEVAG